MITRKIIEAQLRQYESDQKRALIAVEQAKANLAAFNGAIEACNLFLKMEATLVTEQSKKSSEVKEVEPKK